MALSRELGTRLSASRIRCNCCNVRRDLCRRLRPSLHRSLRRLAAHRARSSLVSKLRGFDREAARTKDWNAYREFEPAKVMRQQ